MFNIILFEPYILSIKFSKAGKIIKLIQSKNRILYWDWILNIPVYSHLLQRLPTITNVLGQSFDSICYKLFFNDLNNKKLIKKEN